MIDTTIGVDPGNGNSYSVASVGTVSTLNVTGGTVSYASSTNPVSSLSNLSPYPPSPLAAMIDVPQQPTTQGLLFIGGPADGERKYVDPNRSVYEVVQASRELNVYGFRPSDSPVRPDDVMYARHVYYRTAITAIHVHVMVHGSLRGVNIVDALMAGYRQKKDDGRYATPVDLEARILDAQQTVALAQREAESYRRVAVAADDENRRLRAQLRELQQSSSRITDCTVHRPCHDGPQRRIVMEEIASDAD